MRIRKAVVTAAGMDHSLPLQRLVARNGQEKTALQLILEEAGDAGIEESCVVIRPGDKAAFYDAAGPIAPRLVFVEQDEPRGYGDALRRARQFTGNEFFLHLVGDHLYLSATEQSCARQLVQLAQAESCSVSAVQATRESKLPYFGVIGGKRVAQREHLYEVTQVLEKPTPTEAEQRLQVAGLPAGHYLCLFGMHVLSPTVMDLLGEALENASAGGKPPLTAALAHLSERERFLAFEINGSRYNIGVKYGLFIAQLALALSGEGRDQVLTELVQMLAERPGRSR
jgi:UTP--glucose-1-phosphate uridylyltransferase